MVEVRRPWAFYRAWPAPLLQRLERPLPSVPVPVWMERELMERSVRPRLPSAFCLAYLLPLPEPMPSEPSQLFGWPPWQRVVQRPWRLPVQQEPVLVLRPLPVQAMH
jgi:hypothetical protein